MKKLLFTALLVPVMALAQTYPSPTFNSVTLQNPLTAANGGTGSTTSTGTGSVVLSGSPTISNPTVTGSFSATGLVTLTDQATQAANTVVANATGSTASPTAIAVPSCSTSSSALGWTSGAGLICNTAIAAATATTATNVSGTVAIANGGTNSTTATGATSNLQYLQGATGSVAESVTAKLQQVVNAADFGALCNGSHDDTAGIQAAVNTGAKVDLPVGTCIVTNAINANTSQQIIEGQGRQRTIIQVPATFNLSASGVFVALANQEGPTFRDFSVAFVQPDTSVRANLVGYPAAFMVRNAPRFRIQHMRISEAIVGIDLGSASNSGGSLIEDVEMSAFAIGITIDGSQDSIRVDKLHFWPFGPSNGQLTANQTLIFNDGNTIGLLSGRADDLHVTNSLFINRGPQIDLFQTASGITFGEISDTDFDSYGQILMSAGQISVTGCFFSEGLASVQAVVQTGGDIRISSSRFLTNVVLTNPMISTATSAGFMQITNSYFAANAGDMTTISVANGGSGVGTLILTGNQFQLPVSTTQTHPVISVMSGGRLTATGNRATDKGTGTGAFISIATDSWHNVTGNMGVGWTYSFPASPTTSIFANNL